MNSTIEVSVKIFTFVSQFAFIATIAVLIVTKLGRKYFQNKYEAYLKESQHLKSESDQFGIDLAEIESKCNTCTDGVENCEYIQKTKDLRERLDKRTKELRWFKIRYSWLFGNKFGAFLLYLANVDFERGDK